MRLFLPAGAVAVPAGWSSGCSCRLEFRLYLPSPNRTALGPRVHSSRSGPGNGPRPVPEDRGWPAEGECRYGLYPPRDGHSYCGRLRGGEIPPAWYQAPVFYFSNPASIHGPGEPVRRPDATEMLDFELEIAAVIGAGGELAGFTLMNDWSARDVQAAETTVRLGPHKAKDFATSLGPWLVAPDELPYEDGRLRVEASVSVNGVEVTRTSAAEQHFAWPELVAHAARDTRLRPGDVLGSGTLAKGCLLELGPQDLGDGRGERFIEPGDVVALSAEGLGRLETPVVA